MANKKIYRVRSPVKTFFRVLFGVFLCLILLFLFVFFYFQKYIVYTETGIRLEIPFLAALYEEDGVETSPPATSGTPEAAPSTLEGE